MSKQTKKATAAVEGAAVNAGALDAMTKMMQEFKSLIAELAPNVAMLKTFREQFEEVSASMRRIEAKLDVVFTAEGTRKPITKAASKAEASAAAAAGGAPSAGAKAGAAPNILAYFKMTFVHDKNVFDSVYTPIDGLTAEAYRNKVASENAERLKKKTGDDLEMAKAALLWSRLSKNQQGNVRIYRAEHEKAAAAAPVTAAASSSSSSSSAPPQLPAADIVKAPGAAKAPKAAAAAKAGKAAAASKAAAAPAPMPAPVPIVAAPIAVEAQSDEGIDPDQIMDNDESDDELQYDD